jgi:hypothetical protein
MPLVNYINSAMYDAPLSYVIFIDNGKDENCCYPLKLHADFKI